MLSARTSAPIAAVIAGVLVGFGAAAQAVPEAMQVQVPDPPPAPARAFPDVVHIPPRAPPPGPGALLEARLAALARAVEAARPESEVAPVGLDVASLDAAIRKLVAPLQRSAAVSVHVRDLLSDAVIFDFQGDVPLNPASNQKLLTSSAALYLLGADYRFETRALRVGDDLVLVGEGDPVLDAAGLQQLAEAIAAATDLATLRRIVVDDAAFSARRFAPGFSDSGDGASYQAPSGALSLNFNTVEVTVARGPDAPLVAVSPASTHVVIDNQATYGRGRVAVRSYARGEGDALQTVIEVAGKRSRRAKPMLTRRRVFDPGLFVGGALAQLLAARTGAAALPVVRGHAPAYGEDATLLARRDSPPLAQVAADALAYSNNFMAEQLLRTIGWRTTQSPGDWDNGAEVVLGYWRALGLDPNALVFENGSGLSERGRVTTSALVDLITVASRVQVESGGLLAALPVAGERGTLRARLRRSGKRVRAKTGTLDGVSGLTGVITAEDGTPQVGFSILTNVIDGKASAAARRKRAEDRIVMAVLQHIDAWEAQRAAAAASP